MVTAKSVIWDWNGTLLNDTELCIDIMNGMLTQKGLHPITHETYRNKFTFPVLEYYESIGWDFNKYDFSEVGMEFIERYKLRLDECRLFPVVPTVLKWLRDNGINQYMLSAMESGLLVESTKNLGVAPYLQSIHGINDNYAHGKLDVAQKMIASEAIIAEESIIIGDTLHDAEIASELGMHCILVAQGHQPFERLKKSGFPVVQRLEEIMSLIKPAL